MKTNRWIVTLLLAAGGWNATPQTAVDLSRQGKLGAGTTLPSRCSVGQVFFNTAAPSGTNLYACTTPNNWVAVGTPAIGAGSPPATCSAGSLYLRNDPSNNIRQFYICASANTWTMTGAMSGPSSQRPANCVAGQTWISTDTPALSYCSATGNPGTWTTAGTGAQGPAGPAGPAGPNGNTLLSGAGSPSGGMGATGDFYLDTAAACLYGPKSAAAWPSNCTTLSGGTNFRLTSGNTVTDVSYGPGGLTQNSLESAAGPGGFQTGTFQGNYLSGLFNPANYGNFAGWTLGTNILNGHNQSNNEDKKTMYGLNLNTQFKGGGQRFGIGNNIGCWGVGDCFAQSNSLYYSSYCTAWGDECVKGSSDQLVQNWNYTDFIMTGGAVKTAGNTTFAAGVGKSGLPTDVKTFQVASTAGFHVGDWVTLSPGVIDGTADAYEEVVQLTAIGAGPCPGSLCTLSALLQSNHSSGDMVTFAVGLPILEQPAYGDNLGQGEWWVNLSGPVVFNNVSYTFGTGSTTITATGGPSWGVANGAGPLPGGTTQIPGCIAILQDSVTIFDSPIVTITAATNADSVTITAPFHGLQPGTTRVVDISGFTGGWTSLNGKQFVTVIDANTFSVAIDSSSFGAVAGTPVVKAKVLVSYIPVLSVNSSTTLTAYRNYQHAATNATGTGVAAAWFACGRQFTNVPTYNTLASPPTETISQVELEYNGFTWKSGDQVEATVSPFSAPSVGYQIAWTAVGPHGATPTMVYMTNLSDQMASAALVVSGSPNVDSSTKAGYKEGIVFGSNVGIDFLHITGQNVGSSLSVNQQTFSSGGYGGLGDCKLFGWYGFVNSVLGPSCYTANNNTVGDFVIGTDNSAITFANSDPIGKARLDWSEVGGGVPTYRLPNGGGGGTHTICTTDTCPSPNSFLYSLSSPGTNNTVELGYLAGSGGGAFIIRLCVVSTQYAPCKVYTIPGGYGVAGWKTVYPISDSGGGNGYDGDLDVEIDSSNNARVRFRSTGATAATIYVIGEIDVSDTRYAWVPTGTISNNSAPASSAGGTVLTQTGGQVEMRGGKVAFANLGAVPTSGTFVYCTDCTFAPACAGGGTGHMAVSNGTNWTCQ